MEDEQSPGCYAPVKVNPVGAPPGHPQDSDMGPSDHTGDSDYSNSFKYHTDIIMMLQMLERYCFVGDSDIESGW